MLCAHYEGKAGWCRERGSAGQSGCCVLGLTDVPRPKTSAPGAPAPAEPSACIRRGPGVQAALSSLSALASGLQQAEPSSRSAVEWRQCGSDRQQQQQPPTSGSPAPLTPFAAPIVHRKQLSALLAFRCSQSCFSMAHYKSVGIYFSCFPSFPLPLGTC